MGRKGTLEPIKKPHDIITCTLVVILLIDLKRHIFLNRCYLTPILPMPCSNNVITICMHGLHPRDIPLWHCIVIISISMAIVGNKVHIYISIKTTPYIEIRQSKLNIYLQHLGKPNSLLKYEGWVLQRVYVHPSVIESCECAWMLGSFHGR